MLSKIQIASGVLATAHGLTQITDPGTGALLALKNTLGCAECLLSGHNYCKQRGWWEWIVSGTAPDAKLPSAYGICCSAEAGDYQCTDASGVLFTPTTALNY